MSVGVKQVDDDHRQLISIVNDFEAATRLGAGQVDEGHMRMILAKLNLYAREHFAREEKIQEASRYEGLAENKRQHQLLLKKLETFIADYVAEKLGGPRQSTKEMAGFLNDWLVEHIIKTDLKMRGKVPGGRS